MTESNETREEKTFGISRGLLLRLVPITLFVTLGTFAVVQSILGEKNAKPKDETALAETDVSGPQPLLDNNVQNQNGAANSLDPAQAKTPLMTADNLGSDSMAAQRAVENQASEKPNPMSSQRSGLDGNSFHANHPVVQNDKAKPPIASAEDLLNQVAAENTSRKPGPGSFQSTASVENGSRGVASQPPGPTPDFLAKQSPTKSPAGDFNPVETRSTGSENGRPEMAPNKPAPLSFSDKPATSPFALNKPTVSNSNSVDSQSAPSNSGNSLRSDGGPDVASNPAASNSNSGIPPLVSQPSPFANPANSNQKMQPSQFKLNDQPLSANPTTESQPNSGEVAKDSADNGNRPGGNFSSANPAPIVQATNEKVNGTNVPSSNSGGFNSGNPINPLNPGNSNSPPANVAVPRTDRSTSGNPGNFGSENLQANRERALNQIPSDARTLANAKPGNAELEGVQTPSLSIEKVAPREIQLDQPTDFKIVVRNVGRVVANDVRVIDQVPAGALFIRASKEPDRMEGTQLTWNLGTLKPNDEQMIVVTLQPKMVGEIGSVAQVTFATPASVKTTVTKPQLSIEHSGPEKVMIGDRVALEINVTNSGNGPAREVVIQENVPPQLKFAEDFSELEYEIGTLAPGQSRKVTLTLAAAQIGRFRNSVLVAGAGGLQAQHHIDMEVVAPKLALSCDGPNRRYLKRNASHTFAVRNVGTAIATNLDLIAKLPSGVRFVSANNQGQYDPGSHAIYWSLDRINTGESVQVSLTTTPVEPGDHNIEFIATADLNQRESLKQPLAIDHLVDLFFEIDDVDDVIEVGSETRYRIRLMNQGTTPATNVYLTLACEPGIQPLSTDKNLPGDVRGQEVIFAPIKTIRPGEEFVAIVTAKAISPGEHRVVANLRSDQREEMNVSKEESTRVYTDR